MVRHTYVKGWHLPGGGVERGESVFDAAIKELIEEVGIKTTQNDLRLLSVHANFTNFKGDHVALFHCNNWQEIHTLNSSHSPHEIAEWGFFSIDELPAATTRATRERIEEFINDRGFSNEW